MSTLAESAGECTQNRFPSVSEVSFIKVQHRIQLDIESRIIGNDSPVAQETHKFFDPRRGVGGITRKIAIPLSRVAVLLLPWLPFVSHTSPQQVPIIKLFGRVVLGYANAQFSLRRFGVGFVVSSNNTGRAVRQRGQFSRQVYRDSRRT